MAGRNVTIFLHGCTGGSRGEDIRFHVGLGTRTRPSLAEVNRLSLERRFGRRSLDAEQDPVPGQDVAMRSPGIPAAARR